MATPTDSVLLQALQHEAAEKCDALFSEDDPLPSNTSKEVKAKLATLESLVRGFANTRVMTSTDYWELVNDLYDTALQDSGAPGPPVKDDTAVLEEQRNVSTTPIENVKNVFGVTTLSGLVDQLAKTTIDYDAGVSAGIPDANTIMEGDPCIDVKTMIALVAKQVDFKGASSLLTLIHKRIEELDIQLFGYRGNLRRQSRPGGNRMPGKSEYIGLKNMLAALTWLRSDIETKKSIEESVQRYENYVFNNDNATIEDGERIVRNSELMDANGFPPNSLKFFVGLVGSERFEIDVKFWIVVLKNRAETPKPATGTAGRAANTSWAA